MQNIQCFAAIFGNGAVRDQENPRTPDSKERPASTAFNSMFGQLVKPHASDLRDTSTTQSAAGKKARTAFDITAGTSAVTLAVKPRQAAYKAGPGIVVLGSDASRRDADKRFGMRWSRI